MSLTGVTAFRYENGNSVVINTQTVNYTLVPDDNGNVVVVTSGTAKTVTVPQYLPIGFRCAVIQGGAGQLTFATSSTTVNNRQAHTKTAGQHAKVELASYAADTFNLSGDTAA